MTAETHGLEVRLTPSAVRVGDLLFVEGDWREVALVAGAQTASSYAAVSFLVKVGERTVWVKRRRAGVCRVRRARG